MNAAVPLQPGTPEAAVRVPRPIPSLPALSPANLLTTGIGTSVAFPFVDTRTEYFYMARGAVWHGVRALGLEGKEVLVPAYHHGVEIEALQDAGVELRFFNVKPDFMIDLPDLVSKITPKTKALYVIHYAGFPQPMAEILSIARAKKLKVVEDCALALYSADGAKPLGSRGDAGIFCLYKTIPTPHGGALWMPNGTPVAKNSVGLVSTAHQMVSSMLIRAERETGFVGGQIRAAVQDVARAVRSVRPLPVDATPVGHRHFQKGQENLAIAPLARHIARNIPWLEVVEKRRQNYYALQSRLRDIASPMVTELRPGVSPLFYPLWCANKPEVHRHLVSEGVDAIDFWNNGSPLVVAGDFPDVDALRKHVLELPIHQDLDLKDIEALEGAVRRAYKAAGL